MKKIDAEVRALYEKTNHLKPAEPLTPKAMKRRQKGNFYWLKTAADVCVFLVPKIMELISKYGLEQ